MKLIIPIFAVLLTVFEAEAQPVITAQPTNQTAVVGGSASFTVAVSGTGPFTYQWQLNGTNLPTFVPLISTVAGNGTYGYSGDYGAASSAELNDPHGVAVDGAGNLYIADMENNVIREVRTNGIISTVVGYGAGGYSGDGGAAIYAELWWPKGVATDSAGNLYIADYMNNRIRKVGTNGIISTVAGGGTGGDGGAATNAGVYYPNGVTVDSAGNLYIAEGSNNLIRKVGTNGIISTVAGNGTGAGYSGDGGAATNAKLFYPYGVTVDSAGNLYIADTYNNRIRIVVTNGIISTVAGNGINGYVGGELNDPSGVTVDSAGNLYIADTYNNRILKGGTIVAGGGTGGDFGAATNAELNIPFGVTVDSVGNLYIADTDNQRIRKVWNNGSPLPTLTLNNVTAQNRGNYQVIITGNGGSVTSSVASLTIQGYNQIANQLLIGGTMQLSFVGLAGANYALDRSFSLSPANWVPVITNPADVNGNLVFTNAPGPTTNNFWRIRSVP